jgi:hypothetical protein
VCGAPPGEQRPQLVERTASGARRGEHAIEGVFEPGRAEARRCVADDVRGERVLRIDAAAGARERERRAVGRDDRAAIRGDVGAARVARIVGELRGVDDGDLELAQREQREEDDEERAQPRDPGFDQDSDPEASRSRNTVKPPAVCTARWARARSAPITVLIS